MSGLGRGNNCWSVPLQLGAWWRNGYGRHCITLLLLAFLAVPWLFSLPGVYLFDDYITPLSDPASQGMRQLLGLLGATLRPLTKLTYALEATFGVDTVDFRRSLQIAIHLFNTALLFHVLKKCGDNRADHDLFCLPAAALYSLHPIQAEKILAIAGRSTLLMESLLLGAILCILHKRFRTGVLLYLCSLFFRETALFFLPLIWQLLPESSRKERWALVFMTACSIILIWHIPRYRKLLEFSFLSRDIVSSCVQQVSAIPVGLSLYCNLPHLSIDHGEQLAARWSDPLFVVGGLVLFVLLAAFAGAREKRLKIAVGWILASLLPTQSCIPKLDPLTERPFALALPGVIMLLLYLVRNGSMRQGKKWVAWSLFVPLMLFAAATAKRSMLYRDEGAMWEDAMVKSEGNIRPHLNYATILIEQGKLDAATEVLMKADAIKPFDVDLADKLRMIQYKKILKEY